LSLLPPPQPMSVIRSREVVVANEIRESTTDTKHLGEYKIGGEIL
jgi:hypothetical protein